MEQLLLMLKNDLGISSASKDDYFTKLITSCTLELQGKGMALDVDNISIDDKFLIVDYATWRYRTRSENVSMPINLMNRIRNRVIKGRCNT